jgi:integrase
MTGARLSEILKLEKAHFSAEAATIALPGDKGGEREAHPISGHVLSMIMAFPVIDESPWLFPREDDPQNHVTVSVIENAWQRIRIRANVEDARIHDLRHTVGTYATQSGVNAFIVRDLLRHKNVTTTNRYSNFDAEPVRHALNAVGDRIAAALAGGKSAEIVPLRRGGK